MYREWLIDSLEKTKKSQADLARATGLATAIVNRMVLGKRAIRDHEIVLISKVLGILPPAVPKGRRDVQALEVELIPVVGVAQDGVWRDKMSAAPRPIRSELPAPPSAEFAGLRMAVQIITADDPADGEGPQVDNEFVIFVPIERIARPLRNGDHVYAHVTADRFQQSTILRCRQVPGKVGTFVSVQNPTSQPANADQVKQVGLVVGSYRSYRT